MPLLIHDDPDMVFACPECDVAGGVCDRDPSLPWTEGNEEFSCWKCGHRFDEPIERENQCGRHDADYEPDNPLDGSPATYEAKLSKMDPSEFPPSGVS